jgi:hypothetical protein
MDQSTANQSAHALLATYDEMVFQDITRRPASSGHHKALVRTIEAIPTPLATLVPYSVHDGVAYDKAARGLFVTPGALFRLTVELEGIANTARVPAIQLEGSRLTDQDRCVYRAEPEQERGATLVRSWDFTVAGSLLTLRTVYGNDDPAAVFARALAGELGWDATAPTV